MKLEIKDLKKSYGARTVLEIGSLALPSGVITAVVGPNGAGKTTLLNLLAGLDQRDGGKILYDGREETPSERMTMVFQEPCLITASVRKNIMWPMKIRKTQRERMAGRTEDLARELGLEPLLDRRADRLSAGEKQKTALARALSFEPELLLLDEPSANLDPGTTAEIERLLEKRKRERGLTVVIVTHNLAQAKRLADHVVLLEKGKAVLSCPADVFFGKPFPKEAEAFLCAETVVQI